MSQDLNAQNSGIKGITSGPLVIRTYNDLSGNNTYMVGLREVPVPNNYVLTTSTGGLLVPTNAVRVSSITVSSLMGMNGSFSTVTVASSITTSSIASLYSLSNVLVNTSTLTGSTLVANTLTVGSTLTASTLTTNTLTVGSTLTTSSIVSLYSLSNILVNTSTLTGSTLAANTLTVASTLTTSSIVSLYSLSNILVNRSTISGSTLQVSSCISQSMSISTLTVSSTIASYINYSIMNGSTLTTSTLTTSIVTYGYTSLPTIGLSQIGYSISGTIAATSGTAGSNFAPLIVSVGVWLVSYLITFTNTTTFPNTVISMIPLAQSYPIVVGQAATTGVATGTYTYNSSGSVTLGLSVITPNSPITVASSYFTATRIA